MPIIINVMHSFRPAVANNIPSQNDECRMSVHKHCIIYIVT